RVQGDWSARRAAYCALIPSAHTIEISASEERNLDGLMALLGSLMPPGPQYYPADWVGDHPERFVIAEFIREKVLELTREEVPHAVAVEVDKIERREDRDLVDVFATLFVERETQARILIGKKGAMLHQIGVRARRDIEALLGSQINLQLWVKTRPDWRDSRAALRELGYE
ncbi:MAG TPA: GTPase Era, partial [Limnochordia bacterium]|nr:GTPase Era [Limnochordia bacterium]